MQMRLCLGDRFATGRKLPDLHWLIFTLSHWQRSIHRDPIRTRPPTFT